MGGREREAKVGVRGVNRGKRGGEGGLGIRGGGYRVGHRRE